ncbi:MAG: hypothetical protein PHC34_01590 [Candidatus Gastranaerophilales bacterium]|nr:hypothetical protein [Candidatus Gastranaerophilales bacterium]
MKKKLIELNECVQEIMKKHINGEDVFVPLSDLAVRANRALKAYESLEEDILSQKAGKKKIYASRNLVTNKKEVNKVAYFLARYEHFAISDIPRQTPALREIADKLGVKLTTLRNKRDCFDYKLPESDKADKKKSKLPVRNGWQQDLSAELQETFNYCNGKPYKELLAQVKEILEI